MSPSDGYHNGDVLIVKPNKYKQKLPYGTRELHRGIIRSGTGLPRQRPGIARPHDRVSWEQRIREQEQQRGEGEVTWSQPKCLREFAPSG